MTSAQWGNSSFLTETCDSSLSIYCSWLSLSFNTYLTWFIINLLRFHYDSQGYFHMRLYCTYSTDFVHRWKVQIIFFHKKQDHKTRFEIWDWTHDSFSFSQLGDMHQRIVRQYCHLVRNTAKFLRTHYFWLKEQTPSFKRNRFVGWKKNILSGILFFK